MQKYSNKLLITKTIFSDFLIRKTLHCERKRERNELFIERFLHFFAIDVQCPTTVFGIYFNSRTLLFTTRTFVYTWKLTMTPISCWFTHFITQVYSLAFTRVTNITYSHESVLKYRQTAHRSIIIINCEHYVPHACVQSVQNYFSIQFKWDNRNVHSRFLCYKTIYSSSNTSNIHMKIENHMLLLYLCSVCRM